MCWPDRVRIAVSIVVSWLRAWQWARAAGALPGFQGPEWVGFLGRRDGAGWSVGPQARCGGGEQFGPGCVSGQVQPGFSGVTGDPAGG